MKYAGAEHEQEDSIACLHYENFKGGISFEFPTMHPKDTDCDMNRRSMRFAKEKVKQLLRESKR